MNVHLPRISWRRFLASRWFPWALVALFLTALGSAAPYGNSIYAERESYRKEVVKLRETTKRQSFEIAQSEWALKQERNRRTNSKREEVRPDGTRIIETETTQEDSASESAGSSTSVKEEVSKIEREEVSDTEERAVEIQKGNGASRYGIGLGLRLPFSLPPDGYDYSAGASIRLFGPWWLEGTIDLDGQLYYPQRFGLGLRWEF